MYVSIHPLYIYGISISLMLLKNAYHGDEYHNYHNHCLYHYHDQYYDYNCSDYNGYYNQIIIMIHTI